MTSKSLFGAVAAGLLLMAVGPAAAQVSISAANTAYFEDFNSLSRTGNSNSWDNNSTIDGWYANKLGYATSYLTNGFPLVSYGVAGTNTTSDRALGISLASASSDTAWFGVRLTNNTGQTIYSADVSFYGEYYYNSTNTSGRFGGGLLVYSAINTTNVNPEALGWTQQNALTYRPAATIDTGADGFLGFSSFQSANLLDGNHANYRTLITGSINFVTGLAAGDTFSLLWGNSSYGLGQQLSDGLAIDDLSVTFRTTLSASAVPEPSAFALLAGLGMLVFAAGRRKGRSA